MDISIVTPTFNQPEWLRLCVNSVLDQTGVRLEHIIQNGGAGNELSWLANQPRVSVYSEKDDGMYDALRKGIARASGSIIAHLNSDEQYLPGTLAKVKAFFDLNPQVDVLFGDAILVNEKSFPLSYRRIVKPSRAHLILCHLSTLTCSAFFRSKLIERGLGYSAEWRQLGDSDLVLSWIDAGVKMATLPEPLAIFTFTGSNLGLGPGAKEEGRCFRARYLPRFPLPDRILELQYRFRKLLGGAYVKRNVEVEIFTQASPNRRVKTSARNISFGWPIVAAVE